MSSNVHHHPASDVNWKDEVKRIGRFLLAELKPKGPILTPFNIISGILVAMTVAILAVRFIYGLGSVTNLSQNMPWGLWIGFDVITGVAFAGGAYVVTFMVIILKLDKYRPIVKITVLNGLLAYIFYAGALLLDLGRPWHVINPIIGNSFGFSSVLFLVAWHFLLYMLAQLLEFSPAIAAWVGLERARKVLASMALGAVVIGVSLSILHQSGLGALYLMAKTKVHPLWYSEFLPLLFLVSSVFAGLSMVILEGTISAKVFAARMPSGKPTDHRGIVLGLSKVCAGALFVYLVMKLLVLVHGQHLADLASGWGAWYLLEVVGFALVPWMLFTYAVRVESTKWAQVAAGFTLAGILLNRLNVSVIAFRWYDAVRYVPTWMEIVVTLGVISTEIWVLRWVVNRMPVFDSGDVTPRKPLTLVERQPLREEVAS